MKRTDAIDAEHRFAFSLKSDLDENDADISIVNGDDAPSRMQSYLGSSETSLSFYFTGFFCWSLRLT